MLRTALTALAASFFASSLAFAQAPATQKPAEAPPQAQESKAGATHEHARDHKQGAPAPKTASDKKAKKKPLHDHRKEHKQG